MGQTCDSCQGLAPGVELPLVRGSAAAEQLLGKGIPLTGKLPGMLHMCPGFPQDRNHLQVCVLCLNKISVPETPVAAVPAVPAELQRAFFSPWISALHLLCCQVLPFPTGYFIHVSTVVNATIFGLSGRTERCPSSFTSPRCWNQRNLSSELNNLGLGKDFCWFVPGANLDWGIIWKQNLAV